ncbi:MAG TPA: GPW/gp25 family protein [Lacibacter sp.]|nr:GPW/gp25 family protein [Lacibacter sp.]
MEEKESFLGTGWSFPPVFNPQNGSVEMIKDVEDINQSLYLLLSTITGERLMQPKYGCDMTEFMFEPVTTTLKTFMKDKIKMQLVLYESRIHIEKLELDDRDISEGRILIDVYYRVKSTNNRYNFVYPFYIKEATELPLNS